MNHYKLVYQTKSKLLEELGFNDHETVVIAGPCSIEDQQSFFECLDFLKSQNIRFLRAGAFKPRTNPYDFQGLGYHGLELLKIARDQYHFKVVSEILDHNDLAIFEDSVDIIQVGARNMQNIPLLKALGKSSKPILLKRGFGNTIDELLGAAEYIISNGNPNIILCERGIRSFDPLLRNNLDLGAVIWLKQNLHLPVIIDPSHASGNNLIVTPMSLGGITAGANGVIVEIHQNPPKALSDKDQALDFPQFEKLNQALIKLTKFLKNNF